MSLDSITMLCLDLGLRSYTITTHLVESRHRFESVVTLVQRRCSRLFSSACFKFSSYSRAFGDRPRNFEPWSGGEDET
ncbi:hypothetical protein TNCV_1318211 [Trichonephila clavipes]|nr:hypothetical protein TNCV_1318211 [Trichonephila clavipes]